FDEAAYYAVFDASILYLKGAAKEEEKPVELEERTLKESLVAASEAGKQKNITKKSIIAYLSEKYGDTVELIGRGQKTGNGKLPLSDNHFVIAADGVRTCFTYVYETKEGGVVSLLRLDAKYVDDLLEKHPDVGLSRFPKNKAGDWYSVVADDSFDEAAYYAVFDASIRYLRGDVTDEPEPMEDISLKESLAVAEEVGAVGVVTKKSIIKHLSETFGEKVELNGRKKRTDNGKLLVSDNHFALGKKRVCFTYVYEDEEGKVTILVKTSAAYAAALRDVHGAVVNHSPFPKNKEKDWYSVVIDAGFTERQVYAFLDDAARLALGESVVLEERTLKESLIAASEAGKSTITKKGVIDYLSEKYGDDVELIGRGKKTGNGKLPLSDNHFTTAADGKRTCFAYVYETEEGGVLSLVRLDAKYAEYLAEKHPDVCTSRFPKNKARDWYSVVADGTFGAVAYYGVFDASIRYLKGEAAEDTAPMEEITLKESLAVAEEIGAVGVVTKKSIIKHLSETFGEKVELNGRKKRTDNGKLLVSDNHFALGKKRVCFTYVYEDEEGKVTVLVKTSAAYADALHDKHGAVVNHSPFPKNKEKDWYSVVIDAGFTEKQVYDFLDDAVRLILNEEPALAEVAATVEEEKPVIPEAPVEKEIPAEEPAEEKTEAPAEEAPVELEELTLKEAIEEAQAVGASDVVSKKSIVVYLDRKYGKKLELHPRKIRTDNGKLLVSDNHFALGEGKRVCFTYIYQDEAGKVVILLRASEEEGQSLAVAHEERIHHSAFPKNKDKDWYSVVVDDSFTAKDVYAMLDRSIKYVLNK
ncbi:MAG: MmcQ/YjbR family DNA-binding protein, partial [Clostridia bacterium]|nr:MmcQ/YjbR family DNA-binding protein [Clostridia bacterium]